MASRKHKTAESQSASGSGRTDSTPVKIKIISHKGNRWNIEISITFDEISQEELPKKLKSIKEYIAGKYNVNPYSLKYQQLVEREITDKGVLAHLVIERVMLEKGRPRFYFQAGISPSGMPYNDMVCYADLYLLDEFEKELTEERVISLLKREGVKNDFIDRQAISDTIKSLKEKGHPLDGVKLCKGRFPDSGTDAVVEFYFHAVPDKEHIGDYISSRKVEKGDILCSKIEPKAGREPGFTVKGKKIPPGKGLDFALEAKKGIRLNMAGTETSATENGLVVVRREERSFMTPAGEKIIPSKIILRIDPMLVIESSDDMVEITTRDSVDIRGNLKMGSRVVSAGEVHVEGNIENNSNILASDDIIIGGEINGSTLSSGKNIVAHNNINKSRLTSNDSVMIKGNAVESEIASRKVVVNKIKGGHAYAGELIETNEIGSDEKGISATLFIGMKQFYQKKIKENNEFIEDAANNLQKLKALFSDYIVKEVMPHNVQQMLLKYLSQLKRDGLEYIPPKKILSYKRLLSAIEPLRRIIHEKDLENIKLKRQLRISSSRKSLIIVKEKITARTKVVMDGIKTTVEPEKRPVKLSVKDKKILKDIYDPEA